MNPKWEMEDLQLTFFKCTRWQVEETLDPFSCPYHYFCDSIYPGDYPPLIDILVLIFVSVFYLATLVLIIPNLISRKHQTKRYLLPSGPFSLPIILLILAKGQRINTLFPVSSFGPAILQLVLVSALAFDHKIDKDTNFVFFEASTISGILHASLYLDSVILPFHTGIDALVSSVFSSACKACVCRKEALVVGGKTVLYKGWSFSTFLVAGVLCVRIFMRLVKEKTKRKTLGMMRVLLEGLAWGSMIRDCVYLAIRFPVEEKSVLRVVVFGAVFGLICLYLISKLCVLAVRWLFTESEK